MAKSNYIYVHLTIKNMFVILYYNKDLKDLLMANHKEKTPECKVCHTKIKKGEMYEKIIGEEAYLCLPCSAASFEKAIYERPIASIEDYKKK